jgi:CTP:phosphocholine cytidylyltransferase-like protein
MTYIILVAGKGSRLHPLTLKTPKTLYKLDKNTTVLQRMVSMIRKHDPDAHIIAVTGFMHETIEKEIHNVTFVHNPF